MSRYVNGSNPRLDSGVVAIERGKKIKSQKGKRRERREERERFQFHT
jgi:hypothetical protein